MLSHYKKVSAFIFLLVIGCSSGSQNSSVDSPLQSYANKPSNFRLSLTDAPARDLKSVYVNVKNFELWLEKEGREGRLILGSSSGLIDLMTLRNGVLLQIADLQMPADITIKQIRVVLEETGHYAVKTDNSVCAMQTPSAQQTGIKIVLSNPVTFEPDQSYSMVIDFDAAKSVVIKGNGGCLLKPVLKIAAFTKVHIEDIDNGGNTNGPNEDLTEGNVDSNLPPDEEGTNNDGEDSSDGAFDPTDPSTWPPEFNPNELNTYY